MKRISACIKGPLEKEMATHSSILARENPMDRGAEPGGLYTVHRVTKSQIQLSDWAQKGPQRALNFFLLCEDTVRKWSSVSQKRTLTKPDHAGTLIWNFYPPNLLFISYPVYGIGVAGKVHLVFSVRYQRSLWKNSLKPTFWPTNTLLFQPEWLRRLLMKIRALIVKVYMKINSTCKVNRPQPCLGDRVDVEDKRYFSIKGPRLLLLNWILEICGLLKNNWKIHLRALREFAHPSVNSFPHSSYSVNNSLS